MLKPLVAPLRVDVTVKSVNTLQNASAIINGEFWKSDRNTAARKTVRGAPAGMAGAPADRTMLYDFKLQSIEFATKEDIRAARAAETSQRRKPRIEIDWPSRHGLSVVSEAVNKHHMAYRWAKTGNDDYITLTHEDVDHRAALLDLTSVDDALSHWDRLRALDSNSTVEDVPCST
ncbi:hypothetical protein HDV00_000036 [Rhizophlyctis rosea]|nr:hypothetical protein HDV00_000036 [Rhizophlyctis rosea]